MAAWLAKADSSNQLAGADYATAMMRAGAVLTSAPDALSVSIDYLTRAAAIFEETLRKNPRIRFARANLGLTNEYLARRNETAGRIPLAVENARQALTVGLGMVKDEPDYASARINVMRSWDVLVHILARSGDRVALAEAEKALETALDYAAHGPKPERMVLFPAEARTWVGDVHAAFAEKPGGTPAQWRQARAQYAESRDAWKKLLSGAPREAPARIEELDKKIAACDVALLAAAK